MEIGDIVNVRKIGSGYWKGKITKISITANNKINIARVEGLDGPECTLVGETVLTIKDGEYWEV